MEWENVGGRRYIATAPSGHNYRVWEVRVTGERYTFALAERDGYVIQSKDKAPRLFPGIGAAQRFCEVAETKAQAGCS